MRIRTKRPIQGDNWFVPAGTEATEIVHDKEGTWVIFEKVGIPLDEVIQREDLFEIDEK